MVEELEDVVVATSLFNVVEVEDELVELDELEVGDVGWNEEVELHEDVADELVEALLVDGEVDDDAVVEDEPALVVDEILLLEATL